MLPVSTRSIEVTIQLYHHQLSLLTMYVMSYEYTLMVSWDGLLHVFYYGQFFSFSYYSTVLDYCLLRVSISLLL